MSPKEILQVLDPVHRGQLFSPFVEHPVGEGFLWEVACNMTESERTIESTVVKASFFIGWKTEGERLPQIHTQLLWTRLT